MSLFEILWEENFIIYPNRNVFDTSFPIGYCSTVIEQVFAVQGNIGSPLHLLSISCTNFLVWPFQIHLFRISKRNYSFQKNWSLDTYPEDLLVFIRFQYIIICHVQEGVYNTFCERLSLSNFEGFYELNRTVVWM